VSGLADWYRRSLIAALTEVGTLEAYWPAPGRVAGQGQEVLAQRFTGVDGAHAWLLEEEENLLAVLAAATAAGLNTHVWQLAAFLFQAWSYRGFYDRWEETARVALDAAEAAGDPIGQSHALAYQARGYSQRGLLAHARELQQRALKIRERIGDQFGLAQSHNALGLIEHRAGDLEAAIARYLRCEEIAAACGDAHFVAIARLNRADALRTQGHLEQAMALLHLASGHFRTGKVPRYAATASQIIADILGLQGRTSEALVAAEQALAETSLLPDPALLAWAQRTHAVALTRAGRAAEAIEALRATAALHAAIQDRQRQAAALDLAADLYAGLGQHDLAALLRTQASELRDQLRADDHDPES
jgi:tetratricopeptide (TPR) repeat protein